MSGAAQGRVRVAPSDVTHDCDTPVFDHPNYGKRGEVYARWRCPECGQRWALGADFLDGDRFYWERKGTAKYLWRRAESRRREAALNGNIGPDCDTDGGGGGRPDTT